MHPKCFMRLILFSKLKVLHRISKVLKQWDTGKRTRIIEVGKTKLFQEAQICNYKSSQL